MLAGLAQLRQGGLTSTDQIMVAEKAGAWSEALALYEQALSQEAASAAAAAATTTGPTTTAAAGSSGATNAAQAAGGARVGLAAADALIMGARALVSGGQRVGGSGPGPLGLSDWVGLGQVHVQPNFVAAAAGVGTDASSGGAGMAQLTTGHAGISSLQVGQLRCLLQMGHHQTLLRQVDGIMARCLGQGAAAAAAIAVTPAAAAGLSADPQEVLTVSSWALSQLAALGVAAAWRLGAWDQLRGYMSVLEAAGPGPGGVLRPLSAGDRWEVRQDFVSCCWTKSPCTAGPITPRGVGRRRVDDAGWRHVIAG